MHRPLTSHFTRWLALAIAASATTCFTGDALVDQPCQSDQDCNPSIDLLGRTLNCVHSVCGYVTRCGDGIVDEEEVCDHGVANVQDDYGDAPLRCSASTCLYLPYCGDGFVDHPREGCDDGNGDNSDACPRTCKPATCGDSFVGPGEACEPGVDAECTTECRLPTCGDGDVDPGEECDDGNLDDSDKCISTCLDARCGDGFVGPGEECDDGNMENQDDCLDTCKQQRCGDGVVGPGEQCDDGNLDDNDGCTDKCADPLCGDGVVQEVQGEECDDGNDIDMDKCLSTCLDAKCGDGVVGPGEQCDDGNASNGDACLVTCQANTCGDGFVGPAEACDDGNLNDKDDCTNACALPTCGDGFLQPNEACDDGNLENNDGCSSVCKLEGCGDGVTQPPEKCDDGNNVDGDGCSAKCKFETCGDGVVQPPEACDDGNMVNTDACVQCQNATCGDGVIWKGQEECDDGNVLDTDTCLTTCKTAKCGDGFVQAGVEACDDGNMDNLDNCLNTCVAAKCGDGFVQAGEACDDGNMSNLDPCKNDCTANVCGDGFVDATKEGCDDQNNDDDDGCSNDCKQGAESFGGGPQAWHFCAIRKGWVRCWGYNKSGQLGNGSTANFGDEPGELPDNAVDLPVNEPGTRVVKVTSGTNHTCIILAPDDPNKANSVRCWGANHNGQLGFGSSNENFGDAPGELPTMLVALDADDIAAGKDFTCAVLSNGGVRCWGSQDVGNLGQPNVSGKSPTTIGDIDLGGKAKQITAGERHACALLDTGEVRCWGSNQDGRLGLKMTSAQLSELGFSKPPSSVPAIVLGGEASQIAAGGAHTCALLVSGRLRCWGSALLGVLGYGNTQTVGDDEHPADAGDVKMLGVNDLATKVVTDNDHTCALLTSQAVRCWGRGVLLGLGGTTSYGTDNKIPPNVDIAPKVLDLVSIGSNAGESIASTCARLPGGRVRCWGDNGFGQLGQGNTLDIGDGPNEMPPKDSLLYSNP